LRNNVDTLPEKGWSINLRNDIYTSSFETLVEARRLERKIKAWKNPQYMCDTLKIDLKL
jgi:hypothetical protein